MKLVCTVFNTIYKYIPVNRSSKHVVVTKIHSIFAAFVLKVDVEIEIKNKNKILPLDGASNI